MVAVCYEIVCIGIKKYKTYDLSWFDVITTVYNIIYNNTYFV